MSEFAFGILSDIAKGKRGVTYKPEDLVIGGEQEHYRLLTAGNIQDGITTTHSYAKVSPRCVSQNQLISPDEILVCMSNGSKRLVGKSSRLRSADSKRYCVGAFCSTFTPNEDADPEFVFQIFQSENFKKHVSDALEGSAINNLKNSTIESFEVPIPPLPEQKKIAEILSRIDSLILKSEMRIQKLQFSHSSFSAEAFCIRPGLDSQEVALGDIVTLRHGYQFRTPDFAENGAKVIKISQVIGDGVVIIEDCDRVPWTLATEKEKFRLNPGDVLMSLTGNIGRVGIVPDTNEVLLQNYRVGLFAPSGKSISREYMIHLLESRQVVSQLEDNSNASAQANFGKGDLDKIMVYLPEAQMQVRTASFLSSSKDRIMKEKRKVEVFRKMKQSISSELLSGRKRVGEARVLEGVGI